MADNEVAVTCESSGESFCISLWNLSSGMQIKSYKGGSCSPHGFSLLGEHYVLAAQTNKPVLHVWNVSKEQIHLKIICPGRISAVVCSPDGNYCVAASAEKFYIWQVATGNLLAVVSRHYQRVGCLKLTDDGAHLLTGGDDSMVMVWQLSDILCQVPSLTNQSVTPQYTWSDHTLPVTDIYCGCGGPQAHVVTSSLDQTCKLYSLASGDLLCSFVFSCGITAVTTDPAEHNLFAGLSDGSIHQVHLFAPAIKEENHINKGQGCIFTGHSKQITSLAVTMDGGLLLSGSADSTARTWHVDSRQCLRTINHKGSVTNAAIIRQPKYLKEPLPRSVWPPLQPFKRHLHVQDSSGRDKEGQGEIPMVLTERLVETTKERRDEYLVPDILRETGVASHDGGRPVKHGPTRHELKEQVTKLRKINEDFYQFAVAELLVEVQESLDKSKT